MKNYSLHIVSPNQSEPKIIHFPLGVTLTLPLEEQAHYQIYNHKGVLISDINQPVLDKTSAIYADGNNIANLIFKKKGGSAHVSHGDSLLTLPEAQAIEITQIEPLSLASEVYKNSEVRLNENTIFRPVTPSPVHHVVTRQPHTLLATEVDSQRDNTADSTPPISSHLRSPVTADTVSETHPDLVETKQQHTVTEDLPVVTQPIDHQTVPPVDTDTVTARETVPNKDKQAETPPEHDNTTITGQETETLISTPTTPDLQPDTPSTAPDDHPLDEVTTGNENRMQHTDNVAQTAEETTHNEGEHTQKPEETLNTVLTPADTTPNQSLHTDVSHQSDTSSTPNMPTDKAHKAIETTETDNPPLADNPNQRQQEMADNSSQTEHEAPSETDNTQKTQTTENTRPDTENNHTETQTNTPPTVQITINDLTDDNRLNLAESGTMITLSGQITSPEHVSRDQVKINVQIGEQQIPATLGENNQWSAQIAGHLLKQHQGLNQLTVKAEVTDNSGTTGKAEASKTYQVDTLISPPIVSIDPIATDDIINLVESQTTTLTITGKVSNTAYSQVKAGDAVNITVGESTQSVTLTQNAQGELRFSAEISTASFLNHGEVKVSVATQDEANNQAQTESQRSYTVDRDILKPVLELDSIAGDDRINTAEAKIPLTISGMARNGVNGQKVIITCGCPSCSGIKWTDLEATISNEKFSVDVQGADLVAAAKEGRMTIKANYTAVDNAGNTAAAEEVSKDYTVDTTPPAISVTIDPIGQDGVINLEDAKAETFTITGSYSAKKGIIPSQNTFLLIGEDKIKVNLDKGKFALNIPKATLLKNQTIGEIRFTGVFFDENDFTNWDGFTISSQYNTDSLPTKYKFDLEVPALDVTIDQIPTINLEVAKKPITLTGKLQFDYAKVKTDSIQVEIKIGDEKHPANVNVSDSSWSLTLPAGKLTAQQGNAQIQAKVTALSMGGNAGEATQEANYTVDTIAPVPTISLTVGEENHVLHSDLENITLKGQVQGDYQVGDYVTLRIHDQTRLAEIQSDGHFSLQVPAAELTSNTPPIVSVHYSNTDQAGNQGRVETQQTYSVGHPDIRITLDPLTTDQYLNVTEGGKTLTLTGSVSGSALKGNTVVELDLNGVKKTVAVTSENTFSQVLSLDELRHNSGYTIKAKVTGDNNATASTATQYMLAPDLVASVNITQIGENFIVAPQNAARISGVVEFDGVYGLGQNARYLRNVKVTIGEKSYLAGFDGKNRSFWIDVAKEELSQLNGKDIHVHFEGEGIPTTYLPKTPVDLITPKNGPPFPVATPLANPTVTVKTLTLTGDVQHVEGNHYRLKSPEQFVQIQGQVDGAAKQDEVVTLQIGNKTVETTVGVDKRFSVNVAKQDLQGHDHIHATLKTTNGLGQQIEVSDLEAYAGGIINSDKFVSAHNKITDDSLAYFIKGVDSGSTSNYLGRTPYGGNEKPLVLKYHFMDPSRANEEGYRPSWGTANYDTTSYTDYEENHKTIIRKAFEEIGKYVNIEFVESHAPILSSEGIRLYRVKFTGNLSTAGAVGEHGGDLIWNKDWDVETKASTLESQKILEQYKHDFTLRMALHELSHNLQMQHTEYQEGNVRKVRTNYDTEASSEFTLMSYNINSEVEAMQNLRMYDLAFLHYRFGVNKNQRTGNDTYSFKNYDYFSADGGRYIWDGAGIDTFDASNEDKRVYVNLTPGSWIYRGETKANYFAVEGKDLFTLQGENVYLRTTQKYFGDSSIASRLLTGYIDYYAAKANGADNPVEFTNYTKDQAFIGYGTQIENLIGSSHHDLLIGNHADNHISGGAGNDEIRGGEGHDYLDGGAGDDRLFGGLGDDKYVIDSLTDSITENENEGTDTVYSTVNHTLVAHVENLTLIGTTANQGTGNGLANTLTANNAGNTLKGEGGDDRLIGGYGEDSLTGGEGKDTFVFHTPLNGNVDKITDFTSGTDKIELSRSVFSALLEKTSNLEDYIKHDKNTGELSYDPDATGAANAIIFAKIQENTDFNIKQDILIV